jgi:hypothetical protein
VLYSLLHDLYLGRWTPRANSSPVLGKDQAFFPGDELQADWQRSMSITLDSPRKHSKRAFFQNDIAEVQWGTNCVIDEFRALQRKSGAVAVVPGRGVSLVRPRVEANSNLPRSSPTSALSFAAVEKVTHQTPSRPPTSSFRRHLIGLHA